MTSTSINFSGKVPDFGRGASISSFQMQRLADIGLRAVKARVAAGIGSDDTSMRPLSKGYFIQKQKLGGEPIRNLRLTGAMLSNLTVRSADESGARIAFTEGLARTKALSNERKTPWLGWAASDIRQIVAEVRKMFRDGIAAIDSRTESSPALLSKRKRTA